MTTDATAPLGAWARSGAFVGLVVAADDREVALFAPGTRELARVGRETVQLLPAGAVTVTVTVDLPVPHGVEEETLRRWVAVLTDPVLAERAREALVREGLDEGAMLPPARIDIRPVTSGAVCLCGARMPAGPGTAVPCPKCGRRAVGPPAGPGRGGG